MKLIIETVLPDGTEILSLNDTLFYGRDKMGMWALYYSEDDGAEGFSFDEFVHDESFSTLLEYLYKGVKFEVHVINRYKITFLDRDGHTVNIAKYVTETSARDDIEFGTAPLIGSVKQVLEQEVYHGQFIQTNHVANFEVNGELL